MHATGFSMRRSSVACPACGEEMPLGMVSCRYCRAPLHVDVVENGSISLSPFPVNETSGCGRPETQRIEPTTWLEATPTRSNVLGSQAIPSTESKERNRSANVCESASGTGTTPILEAVNYQGADRPLLRKVRSKTRQKKSSDVLTKGPRRTIESRPRDFELWCRGISSFVVLLLLAPLAVSGPVPGDPGRLSFTWPMIHSGD